MFNKLTLHSVVILSSFLITYGNPLLQITSAQQETEWSEYVSNKHGFSIQYPSNFTLTEGKSSKYDPDQNLFINSSSLFSFTVVPYDKPSVPLLEYAGSYINDIISNDFRPDFYYILINESIPIEIDGEEGLKFTLSDINKETEKSEIVQNGFFTVHGDSLYLFILTAETEISDFVDEMENHMINSIRWLD